KLAVILGMELDHTGELFGLSTAAESEVAELFKMGIRQVTPIHAIDTRLGGAALFQDGYNTANYFANKRWFNVKDNTACGKGPPRGECVLFHFDLTQNEMILGDSAAVMLGDADHEQHPWHEEHDDIDQYALRRNGQRVLRPGVTNTDGLKQPGYEYLQAL